MPARNYFWIISWNLLLTTFADERPEPICVVNGRAVLNRVSEKFLSLSVDPGVLLAGMNLSEPSLILARHLAPAYIRLAGPTTDLVRYNDMNLPAGRDRVQVTPSMWFGINEWLALTGLTPVFGIGWDPEGVDRLLEISDKLNVSCYWQLGYDTVGRTALQYENDLIRFQRLVAAHPDRKDWRIVGSDVSTFQDVHLDYSKGIVEAFMWEPSNPDSKELPKSGMKLWTSLQKSPGPVTFSTALSFAKQVGRVAKAGYEVVFGRPRMFELFSDTPVYWFSFLHKRLMGVNVLEAKFLRNVPNVEVFAHCSRTRRISSRNGVLTVMVINENEYVHSTRIVTNLRSTEKNVKVQEYILTSNGLDSTDVLLNGQLLSPESFDSRISPKLSLTKPGIPIAVSLPPYSIGFFVISGTKAKVCLNDISESHRSSEGDALFKNIGVTIDSRSFFGKNSVLDDIAEKLRQEMSVDEEYYANPKVNSRIKPKPAAKNAENAINAFNDKAKLQRRRVEYQKRRNELKGKLTPRHPGVEPIPEDPQPRPDRILIRKPRHINLNMLEARFGPMNNTRAPRGINRRLLDSRSKLEESRLRSVNKLRDRFKKSRRSKRDINLDLLKIKAEKKPPRKYKYQEKEATIRRPGQTSDELLAELEKEMASPERPTPPIKTEVLAGLADGSEEESDESDRGRSKYSHRGRSERKKKTKKKKEEDELGEELQFLTSSQEFSDIEEGLPCIHEYFGDRLHSKKDARKGTHFLREFGEYMSEEKQEDAKKKKKDKEQSDLDPSEEDMDEYFRRKRNTKDFSLGDLLYPKNPVEYTIDDDLSVEPLTGLKGRDILEEEHIALENLKGVGEDGIKLSQPILEDLTDGWLPHVNFNRSSIATAIAESSTVLPSVLPEEKHTTSSYEGTTQNVEEDVGKGVPTIGSRGLFDLGTKSEAIETIKTITRQNFEETTGEETPNIGSSNSAEVETHLGTEVPGRNPGEGEDSPRIDLRGTTVDHEGAKVGKVMIKGLKQDQNPTEVEEQESSRLGLRSSVDPEAETEGTKVSKATSATLQATERNSGKGTGSSKIGQRSSSDPETETEASEVIKANEQNSTEVEDEETPRLGLRSSAEPETETEEKSGGNQGKGSSKIGLRNLFGPETETEANEQTPRKEEGEGTPDTLGLRNSKTETEGRKAIEENYGADEGKEVSKIGLKSPSDPETRTGANNGTEVPTREDKSKEIPKIALRSSPDRATTTETTEGTKANEPKLKEATKAPQIHLRGSFDPETEIDASNASSEDPTTQLTTVISDATTNGKITERTSSVAPILRLRLLASDESHELDPRHKRDKLHTIEKTPGGAYRNDIKDRLKQLKDKLRLDPERKRNRLRLQQPKHNQDVPDVQTRTNPGEKRPANDFLEQLRLLRERLQRRKNEIDSMLAASARRDAEVFSKLSKDLLRSRRSLRLQPLSLSLRPRPWHPADVLSLRRDAFLGSGAPARSPPDDYHAFRSLRDRYGPRRSRRSDGTAGNELDARFPDKREEQNVIMKGAPGRVAQGKEGNALGDLNGFLGTVTGFFRDLSRELRDYARQLGILN